MSQVSSRYASATKAPSRRRFLGLLGVAGVAGVAGSGLLRSTVRPAESAEPPLAALWSVRYGESNSGPLVVDQPVLLDGDATVHGKVTVVSGGSIGLVAGRSAILRVYGSLVVDGGAISADVADPDLSLRLRIMGTDEATVLGAPSGNPGTDRGLWVQNGGRVSLRGARRTAYTHCAGSPPAGATTVRVVDATGWRPGDEIVICPTESRRVRDSWDHFDRRTIKSVSGNLVTLTQGLSYPHPEVRRSRNRVYRAEVANLTSNVVVEGDVESNPVGEAFTNGRAFVHIHDGAGRQTFRNVTFRHLGPRRMTVGRSGKQQSAVILGRYSVHFHRNGSASAGSTLTDVVITDCGSRGFVPHATHDLTVRRLVVHNVFQHAVWWDLGEPALDATLRLHIEDSLFARVLADPGGLDDSSVAGLLFSWTGRAKRNRATVLRSSAVGIQGDARSAGYWWPSQTNIRRGVPRRVSNVWVADDLVTHNNRRLGVLVWQNTKNRHVVRRLSTFHNDTGLLHGAYRNEYRYRSLRSFRNRLDLELTAHSSLESLRFTGGRVGSMLIGVSPLGFQSIAKIRMKIRRLEVDEVQRQNPHSGRWDFIDTGLTPSRITVRSMVPPNYRGSGEPGSVLRVQTGDRAWRFDSAHMDGVVIQPFA